MANLRRASALAQLKRHRFIAQALGMALHLANVLARQHEAESYRALDAAGRD